MNYGLHLLVYLDIYVIVSLSLNVIVGYCGLLTLAHAAYYAIGAYCYAILSVRFGWEFAPSVAGGIAIASTMSLAISLPAWRLRGDYLVLATLAAQALISSGLRNWYTANVPVGSWTNLTNGPIGIPGIPRPTVFGYRASDALSLALIATLTAALVAVVLWRLRKSPWTRMLVSIREDELAARGIGKNPRTARLAAFAIASGAVAVGGALYAAQVGYLDASAASLDESMLMLSMVLVGGLGNFVGPIVGAALLVALPEALRCLDLPDPQVANLRAMLYGLLLIVLMRVRPQGIAGATQPS